MPGATVRPTMRQFYLRGGGRAAPPCPQTPCPQQQPPSTLKPWVQTSDLTSGGPLVVVVMVVLGVNVSFVFQAGRPERGKGESLDRVKESEEVIKFEQSLTQAS